MDAPWRIELLGRLRAVQGEREVSHFRRRKDGLLLAYLALHRDRPHPRPELVDLFWPDCEPAAGLRNLRTALSFLRDRLEFSDVPRGALILADRERVRLNPVAFSTDVAKFEAGLQAAERAQSSAERVARLGDALALYRGELLPGYTDGWVLRERFPLAEAFTRALDPLILLLRERGEFEHALRWAHRAVQADRLREEGYHHVIRLLGALGEREAAIRYYRRLRRLLRVELDGATPEPEICDYVQELRRQRHSAAPRTAPSTSSPPPAPSDAPMSGAGAVSTPTGTVTFLLAEVLPMTARRNGAALRPSDPCGRRGELLRQRFCEHGGHAVTWGDAAAGAPGAHLFVAAFQGAGDALRAAIAAQQAWAELAGPEDVPCVAAPGEARVRMALHTGDVEDPGDDYRGLVLDDATRLLFTAHGGQILCSEATALLLPHDTPRAVAYKELGLYRLPGARSGEVTASGSDTATAPSRLFQVDYPNMTPRTFPPPLAEAVFPGHLPLQLTRFFGREAEITRVCELLGVFTAETRSGGGALWRERQRATATGAGPRGEVHGVKREEKSVDSTVYCSVSPCLRGESAAETPRLVTLTGSGGSGKTRLALAVARRLWEPCRGAVWFVALADCADPCRIVDRLREALRLPHDLEGEPLEQVVAFLSRRPGLLVLDNLEHLLPHGAEVVQLLRERVGALTVLITSRQRLELPGEREFPVTPLPTPPANGDPERLLRCASVRLFVDRAEAVKPDFRITEENAKAVAAICRRLEGLPLALELVASRGGTMSPAAIYERLTEATHASPLLTWRQGGDKRHQCLQAALDWSYRLLPSELQRFLAGLSVFRGGCTVEAVEAVCRETAPAGAGLTLDHLALLRGGSLIVAEEVPIRAALRNPGSARAGLRFRMLETIREYAAARLAPEERLLLEKRHFEYYLAVAEQAFYAVKRADQARWLSELDREHANFRASLEWSLTDPDSVDAAVRLAGALYPFWGRRGFYDEGRRWLTRALTRQEAASTDELAATASLRDPARATARARALEGAGTLALEQGDTSAARPLIEEGLAATAGGRFQRDRAVAHRSWPYGSDRSSPGRRGTTLPGKPPDRRKARQGAHDRELAARPRGRCPLSRRLHGGARALPGKPPDLETGAKRHEDGVRAPRSGPDRPARRRTRRGRDGLRASALSRESGSLPAGEAPPRHGPLSGSLSRRRASPARREARRPAADGRKEAS